MMPFQLSPVEQRSRVMKESGKVRKFACAVIESPNLTWEWCGAVRCGAVRCGAVRGDECS
jgi:hypothetical protein